MFYDTGAKGWFQHGLRHRAAGPALEFPNATRGWYWKGEPVSEAEHKQTAAGRVSVEHVLFTRWAAQNDHVLCSQCPANSLLDRLTNRPPPARPLEL